MHTEDLADELYDRDLALDLPRAPTEAVHEIEAALARLQAGTYGRCEVTGRLIPAAQLRAMPWRRS
jgi:DnaK suppressor protein